MAANQDLLESQSKLFLIGFGNLVLHTFTSFKSAVS